MLTNKKIISKNIWLAAFLSLIVSLIIIPIIIILINPKQTSMPKGIDIKNGSRIFYKFLNNVKEENGILVLGTSETGNSLNGNNYYSILTKDEEFNRNVYALGGAGRSANVYFPLIMDNPKAFKNLNLIYYINPTYWRKGLNNFNEAYFNRYLDSNLVNQVKYFILNQGKYKEFLNDKQIVKSNVNFLIDRKIKDFKSLYSNDLSIFLNNTVNKNKLKINIQNLYNESKLKYFKEKINLKFNATEEFLKKNIEFPVVDKKSDFQLQMLNSFIDMCKDYEINCTYYLGPFNEIYCSQKNPDLVPDHKQVLKKIKDLLKNKNVGYIDGTDLSKISGTFSDVQHISEYGAYLTAIQIKKYYEKTK